MIEIDIPDFGKLYLSHLILDYNGTMACDGKLLPGVKEKIEQLADKLIVHVITADTFGFVKTQLTELPCKIVILTEGNQDIQKMEYVESLGVESCISIGNGRNDGKMLKVSVLGIAVILEEGASTETLLSSDIVTSDINSALNLLLNPLRLKATLRS